MRQKKLSADGWNQVTELVCTSTYVTRPRNSLSPNYFQRDSTYVCITTHYNVNRPKEDTSKVLRPAPACSTCFTPHVNHYDHSGHPVRLDSGHSAIRRFRIPERSWLPKTNRLTMKIAKSLLYKIYAFNSLMLCDETFPATWSQDLQNRREKIPKQT